MKRRLSELAPHEEHGFFDFLKCGSEAGRRIAGGSRRTSLSRIRPPVMTPDLNGINP